MLNGNNLIPKTKEEYVADNLREIILRGYLKPGDRLDQDEIAQRLGVSRIPLRSAIRTLSAEGLIELNPHYGATVTKLSPSAVQDIFQIRAMVEGYAAQLAAPNMKEDDLRTIQSILDELTKTTSPDEWVILNREFHRAIYKVSVSPHYLMIVENLRNTTSLYARAVKSSSEHREIADSYHQRIFDACVNRDGITAQLETKKHLGVVGQQVVELMTSESRVIEAEH
jgi:DNA-binding GntR family transcriptional regulator